MKKKIENLTLKETLNICLKSENRCDLCPLNDEMWGCVARASGGQVFIENEWQKEVEVEEDDEEGEFKYGNK